MNDLISRKDLLDYLNDHMYGTIQIYPELEKIIKNFPTAFDVDKLLEDIKSRRSNNLKCSKMQINPVSKKIAYYNRAVEDEAVINIIENEINKRKEKIKNNGKNKIN